MIVFASVVLLTVAASTQAEDSQPQKRVLIVTGEDYPGHKWQLTAPALKMQLEQDSRLRVETLDDLRALAETDLSPFDAVVIHFKNYDPSIPGQAGLDRLVSYVEQGGGLVAVHFACGAFQEFKQEYELLVGRVWNPELRGHDPYGTFRVDIVTNEHKITQSMKSFETEDELYTCLDGDTPIQVLATSISKVDSKTYPIAFVVAHPKKRVFHCLLGHNVMGLENAGAAELYRKGTAWAAGMALPSPHQQETSP
ncbi:ThuA domain-containing protein [Novipirellula artificiosorum]|nr:ThuA domain-containing protein [Novipirellula artificiosorum]